LTGARGRGKSSGPLERTLTHPIDDEVTGATGVPTAPRGLESDEVGARVVSEELRLLAIVNGALEAGARATLIAQAGKVEDDARLLELRDDVAVAKPDDLPALFEQMHTLGALRAQRGKGVVGSIDRASPYFGHLRLEENKKRRDVLIGGRSYVDGAAGVRIVDWRQAPVSRIFYRYQQDEDYEEPMGGRLVEGVVLARRSVAVVGGELVRVAAPEGTFLRGEGGLWRRVDSTSARLQTERRFARDATAASTVAAGTSVPVGDKHLPAIASMLDKDQFDLITRPGAGLVAVQGSAGSGKTTVGLHRVAYLAFADPQRFRPDKMMVVVPHDALLHYVARVLPSLGVEGVTLTTFTRLARRVLPEILPKLPTRLNEETPPVVMRAKTHPAMLRALHKAGERLHAEMDEKAARAMTRWPAADVVVRAWAGTARDGATCDQRVTSFAQWVAGKRSLPGVGAAAALPDVTRGAVEKLGQDLRNQARRVTATWDEILTARESLAQIFEGEPGFGPGQLDRVHDWCVRQARVRSEGERDGETATIDAEDAPLLLRLWQVLRGPLSAPDGSAIRFAHVFIDEVQDASPIELRVLLDLATKERSVTLAGDTAQRMLDEGDDAGEFDWKKLLEELGVPATTLEPLKVSYRSTTQITRFAREVLGPYAHDSAPTTTRDGPPVELFTFASQGEAVAFLADALKDLANAEPTANVALVTRFAAQADVFYEGLERAEVPRMRRVAQQDFTWEPGFDVTDVRQTKGLEFDEVILLETTASSYPDTAQARHTLYVGATRAAHQLWCVASEKPSPVVTAAIASANAV
jgi:DNA helicase II / ATP-dependent DNA helicase PcrA